MGFMNPSGAQGIAQKRMPELDGIRGVAISLVLFWHYIICQLDVPYDSVAANVKVFFALTWSGVDLFFVLSGFLLGGILMDNKGSSNYFKVFYIRRACRIFPLYYSWLFILLMLAFVAPSLGTMSHFGGSFWSYLTYLQNF